MDSEEEVTPSPLAPRPDMNMPKPRPDMGPAFPNPDMQQAATPLAGPPPEPPGFAGPAAAAGSPLGRAATSNQSLSAFMSGQPSGDPLYNKENYVDLPMGLKYYKGPSVSAPLSMAMPGNNLAGPLSKLATTMLGRSAMQGVGSAADSAIRGQLDPTALGKDAGKGALFNAGVEMVLGPLGRFFGMQKGGKEAAQAFEQAGKTAKEAEAVRAGKIAHDEAMTGAVNAADKKAYNADVAARDFKIANDKAMTGAVNATEKSVHAGEVVAHAHEQAAKIAADLEKNVPALKGSTSLYDMIYGSGRQKVKDAFDASLEAVKENGKGKLVDLPIDVANAFGIEAKGGLGVAGLPADVQRLFAQANKRTGMDKQFTAQATQTVKVDAAELADKMTGFGRKEPKGYRQAAEALDAAGLGDPAARQAYKYYTGWANYIDKSKAFKGEVFNPEKFVEGASSLKNIDEIRRRGMGSATEGPLASVTRPPVAPTPRNVPPAPPEIQQPTPRHAPPAPPQIPQPTKPDVTATTLNPYVRHLLGGAAGGGVGHAIGHPYIGYALGSMLGHMALPNQIVTKGPVNPVVEGLIRNIARPLDATQQAITREKVE